MHKINTLTGVFDVNCLKWILKSKKHVMYSPVFDDPNNNNFNLERTDEERLKSLISILNGHEEFIIDLNGKIVSSNLEAVTITGYEEWEVIGKSIDLIYTRQDIEAHRVEEDLLLAAKNVDYTTTDFKIKKHGDKFLAKTQFTAIYNIDGELNGYRITLSDATHNALYKLRTRIIQDEYTNLFNNPYVGVFKVNFDNLTFLKLNHKALDILGLNSDTYKLRDIFSEETAFTEFVDKLVSFRQVDNFIFKVKHKYLSVYASITCMLFFEDRYVEGVIKDVSENWRQVIELQKLKAELDTFLYRASHDIRAPLTTILGLTNLIKSDKTGTINELLEYAKLIEDRVAYLDKVLKDLSDISYNNVYSIKVQPISLDKLINRILDPLKYEYPQIQVIHDQQESDLIFSDMARLKVILSNVIINGFKYHKPVSINPFIRISYLITNSAVSITVEDNGVGIDQNYLSHVFDIFFKLNTDGTGSGLGLFVTKSMVDRLGGQISIESGSLSGTIVRITIPNCKK
ncbi:MAG: PAS domain S-box protein [Cytophagia bacterium]|nr:PAS domain S-box protein [Cytophagia bacterium]